jgi:hypothetical protein
MFTQLYSYSNKISILKKGVKINKIYLIILTAKSLNFDIEWIPDCKIDKITLKINEMDYDIKFGTHLSIYLKIKEIQHAKHILKMDLNYPCIPSLKCVESIELVTELRDIVPYTEENTPVPFHNKISLGYLVEYEKDTNQKILTYK